MADNCLYCGKPFDRITTNQKFCPKPALCKKRFHNKIDAEKRRKGFPLRIIKCETPNCKTKFKQNNHRHRRCAECSRLKKIEYQKKRYRMKKAGVLPEPKKKEINKQQINKSNEAILCPWERGDIKPVLYGGVM